MHKLKSITIKGFRGQSAPIIIDLKNDANFLIGRNGTGKTTLINLIHAALAVDVSALRETKFEVIDFRFSTPKSRKQPRVNIQRSRGEFGEEITYIVQKSSKGEIESFELIRPMRRRMRTIDGRDVMIPVAPSTKILRDVLSGIYRTTWLSLQRKGDSLDVSDEFDEEEDRGTDVDQKLDQVLNNLVRYFSRLDRSVAEKTREFQKRWFLSFLASNRSFNIKTFKNLDLKAERKSLESIFENFEMESQKYESELDKHFSVVERAQLSNSNNDLSSLLAIFDSVRLHTLVDEWDSLLKAQADIYYPKTAFVETASNMLFRKTVEVNSSNQVVIVSRGKDKIPNRSLSSGEKQLLIFLGETLLQEGQEYIFLADEPELSLHIEWQEELVSNLLKVKGPIYLTSQKTC